MIMETHDVGFHNRDEYNLENDAENEFEVRRKRKTRRSSFFNKRSIVNEMIDSCSEESNTSVQPMINSISQETKEINEYIKDLENEKKDWKNIYRDLKGKYRLLNNGPHTKTELMDHESYSQYLTGEDKKFLADQPSYRGVCILLDQTTDTLALTTASFDQYKQITINYSKKVEEKLENIKNECIKRLEDESFNSKDYNCGNVSMDSVLGDPFL